MTIPSRGIPVTAADRTNIPWAIMRSSDMAFQRIKFSDARHKEISVSFQKAAGIPLPLFYYAQ